MVSSVKNLNHGKSARFTQVGQASRLSNSSPLKSCWSAVAIKSVCLTHLACLPIDDCPTPWLPPSTNLQFQNTISPDTFLVLLKKLSGVCPSLVWQYLEIETFFWCVAHQPLHSQGSGTYGQG